MPKVVKHDSRTFGIGDLVFTCPNEVVPETRLCLEVVSASVAPPRIFVLGEEFERRGGMYNSSAKFVRVRVSEIAEAAIWRNSGGFRQVLRPGALSHISGRS